MEGQEVDDTLEFENSQYFSCNNSPSPTTATNAASASAPQSPVAMPLLPLPLTPSRSKASGLIHRDSELEEEFHVCPNGAVSACDFCTLLTSLVTLSESLKRRDEIETSEILEDTATSLEEVRHYVDKLRLVMTRFDYSEDVQYNGYRSWVALTEIAVRKAGYLVGAVEGMGREFAKHSHVILFEKLLDWSRVLRLINVVLQCILDFAVVPHEGSSRSSSLFTYSREALEKVLAISKERGNAVGFHGRLNGFQFCKSFREAIRVIGVTMAAYTHVYNKTNIFKQYTVVSPFEFLKYWRNPGKGSERIVEIYEHDALNFFIKFWRLPEEVGWLRIVSNRIGDPVETNLEISIPPVKMNVPMANHPGRTVTILPPFEYVGVKPVMVRLVSHKVRHGSVGSSGNSDKAHIVLPFRLHRNNKAEGISKCLIIHVHGGGFVAQSSNSQLVYLKTWAKGVGVPILSIDYTLAPEAPYPRALHEVLYAYVWALENSRLLGSTGQRVIVAGDSAGGQLLAGLIILCIELGIRVPDGAMLIYCPLLTAPAITPSRLLCLTDPLIPYAALAGCMGAYLGNDFDESLINLPGSLVEGSWESEDRNFEDCAKRFETLHHLEELEGVSVPEDYHLSPLMAPDDILRKFPRTAFVSAAFDPCLDDCVEFVKRLRDLGVSTSLEVQEGIPHGFSNFGMVSGECLQGINVCIRRLRELLGII